VPHGTTIVIETIPEEGYKVTWTDDNGKITTGNSCHFTATGNVTMTVTFPETTIEKELDIICLIFWVVVAAALIAFFVLILSSLIRYSVTGMVRRSGSGRGISGAVIEYTVNGESGSVTTNDRGDYRINVKAGSEIVILNVTKDGYAISEKMPITFIAEKSSPGTDIIMKEL
jgi:hypothetical protein